MLGYALDYTKRRCTIAKRRSAELTTTVRYASRIDGSPTGDFTTLTTTVRYASKLDDSPTGDFTKLTTTTRFVLALSYH